MFSKLSPSQKGIACLIIAVFLLTALSVGIWHHMHQAVNRIGLLPNTDATTNVWQYTPAPTPTITDPTAPVSSGEKTP